MPKIIQAGKDFAQKIAPNKMRRGYSGALNLEPGFGEVTSFAYDPVTGRDLTIKDLAELGRPSRKKLTFRLR